MKRTRRKKNWMTSARRGIEREGAKQRDSLWKRVMGGRKASKKTARSSGGGTSSGSRDELVSALTNLGYKKPQAKAAASQASGSDFDAQFRSAIGKLARNPHMATKKRRRRKKKMPAGLAAYWAKKRRAKNARKAKRRKKANPKPRRRRRKKPVVRRRPRRVQNYRKPARRRRKSNPPKRRRVKIIKTNLRKGTKAFRQFVSQVRAQYGKARVL